MFLRRSQIGLAIFSRYMDRAKAGRDIVDLREIFHNCKKDHSYQATVSPKAFEEMGF